MGRRVWDDGELVEEWDDDALIYRRHVAGGVVAERPYTSTEALAIQAQRAGMVRETAIERLRVQMATAITDLTAVRAAIVEDRAKAQALRLQAIEGKRASAVQRLAAAEFAPALTYSPIQAKASWNAVADALTRIEDIHQALAEFYAYRAATDANTVTTGDVLLRLARLASGVLEDK